MTIRDQFGADVRGRDSLRSRASLAMLLMSFAVVGLGMIQFAGGGGAAAQTSPAATDQQPVAVVAEREVDGGRGRVTMFKHGVIAASFEGRRPGSRFGQAVAAHDLNRDSAADLIIGTPRERGGRVYVFHGPRGGSHHAAHADLVLATALTR